jgi:hypothetical protein
MPTRKQAAKILLRQNQDGSSWRELSDQYIPIPAGTLCRVANSGGDYWPRKWAGWLRHYFGVGAKRTSRAPRRLIDMPANALRWALENREAF